LGENKASRDESSRARSAAATGRGIDVQALTNVNNMLFKILATPDR
jgi:hypothetical protein